MIGATVTVWAIGVAIYEFIYGYFDRRYLTRAQYMAAHPTSGSPKERHDMRCGLLRNLGVYGGYVVASLLTGVSLYASAITLANEDSGTLLIAYCFFGAVIGWHLILFGYEFATSMIQVGRLARTIRDP